MTNNLGGQLRFFLLLLGFFAAAGAVWWWVQAADKPAEVASPTEVTSPPQPLPLDNAQPIETSPPFPLQPAETPEAPPTTGAASIAVTVVDQYGNVASDAAIMAAHITWGADEPTPEHPLILEAETDANGEHAFADLPEGRWAVRAWNDTGSESAEIRLAEEDAKSIKLALVDAAPTGGIVINADGAAIEGAVVYLYQSSRYGDRTYPWTRATAEREYTGEDGRFLFPILYTGEWRFYIDADNYAPFITGWERAGDTDLRFALTEGATVRGHAVRDETGEPLAGITIHLFTDYARDNFETTTTVDGRFEIPNVRPGEFTLSLYDDTLVLAHEAPKVHVADAHHQSDYLLRLTDGATVSGRVYDLDTGAGIPGAKLLLSADLLNRTTTTDSSGRYKFAGIPAGDALLFVDDVSGYIAPRADAMRNLSATPSQTVNMDFGLTKGIAVSGLVVDQDANPVPEAVVSAIAHGGGPHLDTSTDAQGRFQIAGLSKPGEVWIEASKAGYAAARLDTEVPAEGLHDVTLTLGTAASIGGIVVDEKSLPVAGAAVSAFPVDRTKPINSGDSDTTGAFVVGELQAGTYRMHVTRPGARGSINAPVLAEVALAEGEHKTGVRLVLDLSGGVIAGRVTNSKDKPVAGAHIRGWGQRTGPLETTTNADGRYEFTGVKDEPIQFDVRHNAYTEGSFSATPGDQHADVVLLGKGAIEGQVVDARTRAPIRSFRARAYTSANWHFRHSGLHAFDHPEGRFRLDGISAEDAQVAAEAEGYARTTVSVGTVNENEIIEGVIVALERAATVRGVVLDPVGNAVSGARLYLNELPESRSGDDGQLARTDIAGRFEVASLPPGHNTLIASHHMHAPGYTRTNVQSEETADVEIVLQEAGTLRGVVTSNGTPARAQIFANFDYAQFNEFAGEDGTFTIHGIAPGNGHVTAILNATRAQLGEYVTIRASEITEVRFDFNEGNAVVEGTMTIDGAPIRGWVNAQSDAAPEQTVTANGEGAYRLEGLVPGNVTIQLMARLDDGTSVTSQRTVTVAGGEMVQADFILEGGPALTGAVTGVPDGYRISIDIFDGNITAPSTPEDFTWIYETAHRGSAFGNNFTLRGIEPGDYTVFVMAWPEDASRLGDWSHVLRTSQRVTVPESGEVHLDVQLH